jgi:hypothetical protein
MCGEMVHDNDVMCCKCDESYCYCCDTPYDVFSRLALLHARFTVLCEPTITAEELTQFMNDISSNEYKTFIQNNEYYCEEYKQQLFEAIRRLTGNSHITCDNIKEFFANTLGSNIIDFVCSDCHNEGPAVLYEARV